MRVSVLLPYPGNTCFDYIFPVEEDCRVGKYVLVPFGPREMVGVVWHIHGNEQTDSQHKLKMVIQSLSIPPMTDIHRQFLEKMAQYTMTPLGQALKLSLITRLEKPLSKRSADKPAPASDFKFLSQKKLSDEQEQAVNKIKDELFKNEGFAPILLDGVTGAGKTEVYLEIVEEILKEDRCAQCLIMMPEIALTKSFEERFEKRFGTKAALWHAQITPVQRKKIYMGVLSGQTRLVLGARSSVFLPFVNLRAVIVDEEHDTSYKQEEGILYNGRDMAVMLAYMRNIPIVLASATPSLESFINAQDTKYRRVKLNSRYGEANLPNIEVIDMRNSQPERPFFISDKLLQKVQNTIETGFQSLLFLNRRGYAPLTLCRSCGYRFECSHCSAWLVSHEGQKYLNCHHCGAHQTVPDQCPDCGEIDSFVPIGPGVERIAEEVKARLPEARVLVLSSDTAAKSLKELQFNLDRIKGGDVDVIIGTQIMAKGHNFPKLATIGVVDADLGLKGGDLRASERTYQLLHQVAGRAGRKKGTAADIYLQTWFPEHAVMEALVSGDRDAFLNAEQEARKLTEMPPYTRLAAIIIKDKDEARVQEGVRALERNIPKHEKVSVIGPAQAPIYKIRDFYRYRFLVQADKAISIQSYITQWLDQVKISKQTRVQIDIDPITFL